MWVAPREGGYRARATGQPKPPPPEGRGSVSPSLALLDALEAEARYLWPPGPVGAVDRLACPGHDADCARAMHAQAGSTRFPLSVTQVEHLLQIGYRRGVRDAELRARIEAVSLEEPG